MDLFTYLVTMADTCQLRQSLNKLFLLSQNTTV